MRYPVIAIEAILFLQDLESNPCPLSKLHRRLDSLWATQWAPRDTRANYRGEWSSLLQHEMRHDSQRET